MTRFARGKPVNNAIYRKIVMSPVNSRLKSQVNETGFNP